MKINKNIKSLALLLILVFSFCLSPEGVSAQGSNDLVWDGLQNDIQANTGLGNDDPRNIAANLINIVLGFLGIVSLVLIIVAGFRWMTAQGNDQQVTDARKLLLNAVVGLVIILSAYALAAFILDVVFRAATDGTY